MDIILGIDVGGTGIKGALVDVSTGELVNERIKYLTPKPATPEAIISTTLRIAQDMDWVGKPVGIGFPAIVKHGVTRSASNIDKSWIDYPAVQHFSRVLGTDDVVMLNDADAAGLAEMSHGGGVDRNGVVILLTLGTGIGSAVFVDGKLVPNTELGHLQHQASVYEHYVSNSARERRELKWKQWGGELNGYLKHVEYLFSPDLILLGGGVSKKFHKYQEYINTSVSVVPATLRNNAGIVGAAMAMHRQLIELPQTLKVGDTA